MNRDTFFAYARREPFSGSMTQSQVDGLNAILDAWDADVYSDLRWLAYMLATAFHETAARMQPVRESLALTDGEARRRLKQYPYAQPVNGQAYYGRGLVQLTHAENYKTMSERLGVPLYDNPDLALEPYTSSRIMFIGMAEGLFTGKRLDQFFNATMDDPVGARKIINGLDRATMIAGYHLAFLTALTAAKDETLPQEPDEPVRSTEAPRYPEERKPLYKSPTVTGGSIAGAATTVATVGQAARSIDPKGDVAKSAFASPWFLLAVLLIAAGVLGYLVWKRIDERRQGVR